MANLGLASYSVYPFDLFSWVVWIVEPNPFDPQNSTMNYWHCKWDSSVTPRSPSIGTLALHHLCDRHVMDAVFFLQQEMTQHQQTFRTYLIKHEEIIGLRSAVLVFSRPRICTFSGYIICVFRIQEHPGQFCRLTGPVHLAKTLRVMKLHKWYCSGAVWWRLWDSSVGRSSRDWWRA